MIRAISPFSSDDLLVLERGIEAVSLLRDTDGDGVPDTKEVVATAPGLNHGLAFVSTTISTTTVSETYREGYIFASSDSTLYRWPFPQVLEAGDAVNATPVVINIDTGGHRTRTPIFDSEGNLYLSVGSRSNVDPDSSRSRIRKFHLSNDTPQLPLDFQNDGEVFADGLRNEVGLAFDRYGILWGVENGADRLSRDDLGGSALTENNPAEELHRFVMTNDDGQLPKHYGYPYCWTEYELPTNSDSANSSGGRGTAWSWPSSGFSSNENPYVDADCRNESMFAKAELAMQAHSAPLGITFFDYYYYHNNNNNTANECSGTFPEWMDGFAFVTFHGSWNRDIPTGYKLVYVPIDGETGRVRNPNKDPVDLLAHVPPNAQWEDRFRPVDLVFDKCGRLLVTSDGTRGAGSKIVRIEYHGDEDVITSGGDTNRVGNNSSTGKSDSI